MSDWLMKSIRAEARSLLELAADDDELRADLRTLAEEILAATEKSCSQISSPCIEPEKRFEHPLSGPAPALAAKQASELPPIPLPSQDDADEPLRELTLGRSLASSPGDSIAPSHPANSRVVGEELAALELRCRGKGEAARWAAESQRRIHEGGEFQGAGDLPVDEELAGWAGKLTDGFYWRSSKQASDSTPISILDDIAGCFEALAEGLALVQERQGHGKSLEQALRYLAEAQSAVRRGLQILDIVDGP